MTSLIHTQPGQRRICTANLMLAAAFKKMDGKDGSKLIEQAARGLPPTIEMNIDATLYLLLARYHQLAFQGESAMARKYAVTRPDAAPDFSPHRIELADEVDAMNALILAQVENRSQNHEAANTLFRKACERLPVTVETNVDATLLLLAVRFRRSSYTFQHEQKVVGVHAEPDFSPRRVELKDPIDVMNALVLAQIDLASRYFDGAYGLFEKAAPHLETMSEDRKEERK